MVVSFAYLPVHKILICMGIQTVVFVSLNVQIIIIVFQQTRHVYLHVKQKGSLHTIILALSFVHMDFMQIVMEFVYQLVFQVPLEKIQQLNVYQHV